LEKAQKWNIEQKFAASDNYQGKFVEELTSNGLYCCRYGINPSIEFSLIQTLGLEEF
jgi:hypothetical protein